MKGLSIAALALAAGSFANAEVYFKEQFNDEAWRERWVDSTNWRPKSEMGKWGWTAGQWYGDASDKGIKTNQDARFYGISAKLDKTFNNKDKDLVLQYSVKNEQNIDCGGAYIKLLGPELDQSAFGGSSPYQIMFGPDICGTSTRRTHVIFNYPAKNDNLLIKKDIRCETDQVSHLYTLHVRPDNTFEVFIDYKSVRSGKLEDEWDFLEPKEIPDPTQSKPADWVDAKKIPDPYDVKPEGWDSTPKEIPDPEATKPEDWDAEEDGEWEPPTIPNPEFKGEWKPKLIDNPLYKGEWVHPKVPNPNYKEDAELHYRCNDCAYIGFELWQVKSGTVFDDIIVTDNLAEARAFADETFFAKKDGEKAMFDEHEAEEEKKAAEERKKREEESGNEEEESHDEL